MSSLLQYIQEQKQDAILWQSGYWLEQAGTDPYAKAKVIDDISKLLSNISVEFIRDSYIDQLVKTYKFKRKDFAKTVQEKVVAAISDEEDDGDTSWQRNLPKWASIEELMHAGFVARVKEAQTGYWFLYKKQLVQRTNYVIKPLYHIWSQESSKNRRMIEVTNGFIERIAELPSTKMLSADAFGGELYNHGSFLPADDFNKSHLIKILHTISDQFKICYEMEKLGWQTDEGFFAFYNMAYRPSKEIGGEAEIDHYNEYGVVCFDDKHYLSPSNGKANELVRASDNHYENDMNLKYVESSINFERWSSLVVDVYLENGLFVIPFVVATLFRDLIIKVAKIPHIYAYGPKSSGKSEFGESISNFFFSGKNSEGLLYKPFNLNQGTEYAFWNAIERFNNCPLVLNEFDENEIDEARFRAIKALYDGEGRAKGLKDKNKATMQKVACTTVLLGQYLGNKDDNSVLTRTIPLQFKLNDNRPDEQIKAFNLLKKHEDEGLSSILVELMKLRPLFAKHYSEAFATCRKTLIEELRKDGHQVPERIIKNVTTLIATYQLVSLHIKLPKTVDEFYQYAKRSAITIAGLVNSSSGISDFWRMVEFLLNRGMIKNGNEFKLETVDSMSIGEKEHKQALTFSPAKTVVYLRLNTIHPLYQQESKKQNVRSTFNRSTLKKYLEDDPAYIGWVQSTRFSDGSNTSCLAFDHSLLECNLERTNKVADKQPVSIEGVIVSELMPQGNNIQLFVVRESLKELDKDGIPQTIHCTYKCYTDDITASGTISKGYKIRIDGFLTTDIGYNGKNNYQIDVTKFESVPVHRDFTMDAQHELKSETVTQADLDF